MEKEEEIQSEQESLSRFFTSEKGLIWAGKPGGYLKTRKWRLFKAIWMSIVAILSLLLLWGILNTGLDGFLVFLVLVALIFVFGLASFEHFLAYLREHKTTDYGFTKDHLLYRFGFMGRFQKKIPIADIEEIQLVTYSDETHDLVFIKKGKKKEKLLTFAQISEAIKIKKLIETLLFDQESQ